MSYSYYLYYLSIIYFLKRYLFSNNAFSNAKFYLKLLNALALIYLGSGCYDRLSITFWIVLDPKDWLARLQQETRYYALWIDAGAQLFETVVGPAGLFCCYWVLRGREKYRRLILLVIAALYLSDCYRAVRSSLVENAGRFDRLHFQACIILLVIYAAIGVFYMHPKVIQTFFSHELQSMPPGPRKNP